MNKRKITYRLFCIFFAAFFMFSPLQSVFAETIAETAAAAQTEETVTDASSNGTATEVKEDPSADDPSSDTDTNTVTSESEEDNSSTETNDTTTEETENTNDAQVSTGTASRVKRAAASSNSAVTVSDLAVNIYDYNVVYVNDYDADGNYTGYHCDTDAGINKDHVLWFKGSPSWNGTSALSANKWVNSHWSDSGSSKDNLAVHGIVENKLVNGYPMLTQETADLENASRGTSYSAESLEYLYTPNDDTSVMNSYCEGVTGLFNRQGNHYWFNSDEEDATWDRTTNTFTKTEGNSNRVKFLPFNTRSERTDMEFGMTFELNFEMPYDESEPVDFSFSGDDDVWVYVDDTLLLDIGGIHGAAGGTIDFRNETVTYNYNPIELGATSTDVTGNKTVYTFAELGISTGSFSAGSDHQLKFFYNERGEGLSNCYIDFDLPLMVETTIDKLVYAEEDYHDTADLCDWGFYLMYKAPNATEYTALKKEQISSKFLPYKTLADGTEYELSMSKTTGKFTLRDSQSATFYLPQGSSYYVVEAQPSGSTQVWRPLYVTFQNDDDELETYINNDKTIDITQTQITDIDSEKTKRNTEVVNYIQDGRLLCGITKSTEGLTKSILDDDTYQFKITLDDNYPSGLLTVVNYDENGNVSGYSQLVSEVQEDGSRVITFELKVGQKIMWYARCSSLLKNKLTEVMPEDNTDYKHYQPTYYKLLARTSKYSEYDLDNFYFTGNYVIDVDNIQTKHNLTVTKNVTGNVADTSKKFEFTATFWDEKGQILSKAIVGTDSNKKSIKTDENGQVTFSISNGESYVFSIPEEVKYSIVENTQLSGYTTEAKVTLDSDQSVLASGSNKVESVTMQAAAATATFTNNAEIAPATSMDVTAYWPVAIGAVLILGLVVFTVRRQVKGN